MTATESRIIKSYKETEDFMAARRSASSKRKRNEGRRFWIFLLIVIALTAGALIYYARPEWAEPYIAEAERVLGSEPGFQNESAESAAEEAPPYAGATESYGKNSAVPAERMEIPLCAATAGKKGSLEGALADDHEVHVYEGFTLCYRETYEVAEWVAYTLTREKVESEMARTDKFKEDPRISTKSASLADYKGSGYDRGHLAPAADMRWSSNAMDESFLLSNMTPQLHAFNAGMWLNLESAVRAWAVNFGEVTVVTGPVLERPAHEYPGIGENKVSVPEYFYKALLARKPDGTKIALGFIMPNQKCPGSIMDYAVCIDEIEERTGIDFFSLLEDDEETALESSCEITDWERASKN